MDYNRLAELLFPHINTTPEEMEARYPKRELPEGAKVTRMGPSPTGFMHLGNLYGALVDERLAHQSKGVFYLRIEDTDRKREVEGGVQMIIDAFKSFGLPFDEGATTDGETGIYGPYRQSQRAEIYQTFVKSLVQRGMAYPCFCTEEELSAAHEQQEKNKENFGYYGKYAVWRDRPMEDIEAELAKGTPYVVRFRSEGSIEHKIRHEDLVKGKMEVTENDQDVVILKSDGIPTYHFAHVVDDHLMGTTFRQSTPYVVRFRSEGTTITRSALSTRSATRISSRARWKSPRTIRTWLSSSPTASRPTTLRTLWTTI